MGYFYIGANTRKSKNGLAKIGETGQRYISQRMSVLRQEEGCFTLLKYIEMPNSTKAEQLYVEAVARLAVERAGYRHMGKDHYAVPVTPATKACVYDNIVNIAINAVCKACEDMSITYMVKEPKPNTRKEVKHRTKA
jgi:hypothetical protein